MPNPLRLLLVALIVSVLGPIGLARTPEATASPSNEEQYFLCLVNRARSDPAGEARRLGIDLDEGVPRGAIKPTAKQPLAFDPRLIDAARRHAQWMLQTNELSHEEGSITPEQRMAAAGFTFKPTYANGENLGFSGQTEEAKDPVETMDEMHRGLFIDADIPGRGHRLNLLRPEYQQTGVGVVQGNFRQDGTVFASYLLTQDFALTAGAGPFLTGVVYADTVKADNFYTPREGRANVTIEATRQGDGRKFVTTTWKSGGYTLALPPGRYQVTASGGTMRAKQDGGTVAIARENIALDFRVKP